MAKPILKWAGGKRRIVRQLLKHLPSRIWGSYFEPFLGAGSMFFAINGIDGSEHVDVERFCLSDTNNRLLRFYLELIQPGLDTARVLELASIKPNDRETFHETRRKISSFFYGMTGDEIVTEVLYFNKACFMGTWREDKSGSVISSFGHGKKVALPSQYELDAAREALASERVKLRHASFLDTIPDASYGDFVYCDPPYLPLSKTSNFVSYTSDGFDDEDHRTLSMSLRYAVDRGANVMVSGSDCDKTREIYGWLDCHEIVAKRTMSNMGQSAKPKTELLFTNYKYFMTITS